MSETKIELVPDLSAPGAARRCVRALEGIPQAIHDDLVLLATEVVTNSVRHAEVLPDDRIFMVVTQTGSRVRVEVTDPGRGRAFGPKAPDVTATGGRGLLLVKELSDAWGIHRNATTCVWFELNLRGQRTRV